MRVGEDVGHRSSGTGLVLIPHSAMAQRGPCTCCWNDCIRQAESHINLVLSQDLLMEWAVGWFCAVQGGTAQWVPWAGMDWLRTQVPTH